MGKKKIKKLNAKKEKYAKFQKEKPGTMSFTVPDLSPEQNRQRQIDEQAINRFLRYSKNEPTKEIRERNKKSN